jgi:hypothetical protein
MGADVGAIIDISTHYAQGFPTARVLAHGAEIRDLYCKCHVGGG